MRVLLKSRDGVTAELEIRNGTGETRITTGDGSTELDNVVEVANGAASGPFPDLAALETVYGWAESERVAVVVVDYPEIPTIPEGAVF